jgi:hypothetical protein
VESSEGVQAQVDRLGCADLLRQLADDFDRAVEQADSLAICGTVNGIGICEPEVERGLVPSFGLCRVLAQHLSEFIMGLRHALLVSVQNAAVETLALRQKKAAVRSFVHEGVLVSQGGIRSIEVVVNEAGIEQPLEFRPELLRFTSNDLRQQRRFEFASDDGPDLRDPLRRPQMIQSAV